MRIAILSVSEAGGRLARRLEQELLQKHVVDRYAFARYADPDARSFEKTGDLMRDRFHAYDAWICICACGIAVRAVAPYLESKQTDPAVAVLDETARFVLPVLSGHVGGANALAVRLAQITGAQAAVTTATDTGGHFSPDSFAAANNLIVTDFSAAKEIAVSVLSGEPIGMVSEYPVVNMPSEISLHNYSACRTGIYIGTAPERKPFSVTLQLLPKNIVLGIGCRKGIPARTIAARAEAVMQAGGIDPRRICAVSSIDGKAAEHGLLEYCETLGVPLLTYSAGVLAAAVYPAESAGDGFSASVFVKNTVGVDNVCERAAVCGSGGKLILRKHAGDGVTVSAAEKPFMADGEKNIDW